MKLISPNGKSSVIAHPSKVESFKKMGWKEEAIQSQDKVKSSSKKKPKGEVKENGDTQGK
jgi:hypothetical protein